MPRLKPRGQALIEYGVIIALVALASVGALALMGDRLVTIFDQTLQPFQGPIAPMYADAFDGQGNLDWQFIWGKWKVRDGRMVGMSRWSKAIAALPGPNYTFSMDVQTLKPGKKIWRVTRVVFRFQDTKNYYAVVPKTDGTIELAKMQNGKWRPWLAYAHVGIDPTEPHNYKVRVVGNQIQVWVDGQPVIQYTDPNPIPDGGIGVSNDHSRGAFDNVQVQMEP